MSVLEAAIGWLAPPDCLACGNEGSLLCQNCSASNIKLFGERCWRCNSLSPGSRTCTRCRPAGPLNHVWISTSYELTAQELVRRYKFGHSRAGAEPLANMMVKTFTNNSGPDHTNESYLIVPVPTATSRVRERGFDHNQLLAKKIAGKLRMEYSASLQRLDQIRQLGSRREDRLTQLANSFVIKNRKGIVGRKIILVDDVLTTGGTLISAAKTLKLAGAKQVSALVFAKKL